MLPRRRDCVAGYQKLKNFIDLFIKPSNVLRAFCKIAFIILLPFQFFVLCGVSLLSLPCKWPSQRAFFCLNFRSFYSSGAFGKISHVPTSLCIYLLFSKNNSSNTGWPLGATPFVLVKLMFFSSKCMCIYKKFSIFHLKYLKSAILFAQRKCSCMLSDRKYTTAKFYSVSPAGSRCALL